jgi:hypothetical protein
MPIEFPLSPEKIREEMKRIISKIREETSWEQKRKLSEITIKIGNTPEYGPIFGIDRSKKKITFGSFLNELTPKYYRTNLVEFLIIRETIACFINNDLLFENEFPLVHYILNLCALAFSRKKHEKRSFETKLVNIRNRFLFEDESLDEAERYFHSKIQSLSSIVISQKILFKHLMETFLHFLEELSYTEEDENEVLEYLYRYFSNIPEEIVAPIRLKQNTLLVLEKVVELGFNATAKTISKILGKDHATIYREFNKIASRYNAYFRVQKNFNKLGLHYYFILIRLIRDNEDNFQRIIEELNKIRYIDEAYEGIGENYRYAFLVTLCPHLITNSLEKKLDRLKKNGVVESFEIKPLNNRVYMTTFIEERFEPSIENYKKLLNGKINCTKIKTWDNNHFQQSPPMKFSEKDKNLLRTISVYKSHSLVNPQYYRVFTNELKKFAMDNNVDVNKMDDFLGFMNTQRNHLLEKNLIDFRLELTLTDIAINNILIIKVNCDLDEKQAQELINEISIFSWVAFYVTYDSIIIRILGLPFDHAITNLLTDLIEQNGFEYEKFTINQKIWRFIPYADLYYYQGNKWALK